MKSEYSKYWRFDAFLTFFLTPLSFTAPPELTSNGWESFKPRPRMQITYIFRRTVTFMQFGDLLRHVAVAQTMEHDGSKAK